MKIGRIITCIAFLFIFFPACDLNDFSEVEKVDVITHGRYLLPLAYGEIDVQTIFNLAGFTSTGSFQPDEDGYYTLDRLISEYEISDTLAFTGDLLQTLSHFELRIETVNRIPLGIRFSLAFFDSLMTKQLGSTVEITLIEPPEINEEGKAVSPSHHLEIISLTDEQVNAYKQASNLYFTVFFFLPESNYPKILIHPTDYLTLNVGTIVETFPEQNP